jgi:hypothetical protein
MNRQRLSGLGLATLIALGVRAASAAPEPEAPEVPPAPWQLSKSYGVNEENPEANIPSVKSRNKNPLEFGYFLQDLLEGAERARKAGDYGAYVRYYRAVVKAAPERAKGWSKLCEAYEIVNDHARAAQACGQALVRPGVEMQDYVRFVHQSLMKPEPPTPAELKTFNEVLEHLDKQPNIGLTASHLRCEIGVKVGDPRMLETCTAALAKEAPNDPKTVIFQWTLAVQRGQKGEAARLLTQARAMKLPPENLERMEQLTFADRPRWGLWAGAGIALLLAAAGGTLLARRKRALVPLAR